MSFDASKYSPKENDWFSTKVEYTGRLGSLTRSYVKG